MSYIAALRRRCVQVFAVSAVSAASAAAIAVAMVGVSDVFVESVFAQDTAVMAGIDRTMETYRLDAHIPGLVWGIVQDGRLIHVKGAGVQDLDTKRPVDANTLFRIASMTKAFTALSILKLRDDGKLALDAPAETYVPEMREWKYPTAEDSRSRSADAHRGVRHRRPLG
jgi:CubicO group peptidase (beta-lactamase class C family)